MEQENQITTTSDEGFEALVALPAQQQRFVHLYLTGQYTVSKIAQLLGVHSNTLFRWLNNKDVKAAITEVQRSTHEIVTTQLKAMSLKAASKMNTLMDSPIDGVALQAAKDVLDRTGHKSKQEIKVEKTVKTFEEKLSSLIDKTIVDAEYEVVEDE